MVTQTFNIEKIKAAHFHHVTGAADYGITYQSCRFCKKAGLDNYDADHGPRDGGDRCWIAQRTNERCRGLWKYEVRHYICTDCRARALAKIDGAA